MTISIDMAKARLHHQRLVRSRRKRLLSELDVEYQIALEKGDSSKQSEVATKKQALRDAPAKSTIAAANTPAELKAAWDTPVLGTTRYKNS